MKLRGTKPHKGPRTRALVIEERINVKTQTAEPDVAPDADADPPQGGDNSGNRDRDRGGGSSLERITVNLSSRSVAALDSITAHSGETKTDAINKALQVWAYLQEHVDSGGSLYTRSPGSDELERLRFL